MKPKFLSFNIDANEITRSTRLEWSTLHSVNLRFVCGTNKSFSQIALPIRSNAGILYPSNSARVLSELTPEEVPDQLVIIDGTWSQAKTLVRDVEQLKPLPHFKLAPTQPGQYRIRLEPDDYVAVDRRSCGGGVA